MLELYLLRIPVGTSLNILKKEQYPIDLYILGIGLLFLLILRPLKILKEKYIDIIPEYEWYELRITL